MSHLDDPLDTKTEEAIELDRRGTFLRRWPEYVRLWPIGNRIRTKVTIMSFLWAQGGLLGYIVHSLLFVKTSGQPPEEFLTNLFSTQLSTVIYIGGGTTVFITLLGNLIGHIIELLEQQNVQLRDLNTLKDKFVATCTHDLQNPLSNMIGYAQVIQTMDGVTADVREFAEVIEKNGEVLTYLIRDILDLAKIGSTLSFESEPIALDTLVAEQCMQNEKCALKKAIEMHFSASSVQCLIRGNRKSLARILNNLLSNAIKFTPRGGVIKVSVQVSQGAGPRQIALVVEDTGIGIPPTSLAILFDTFTKACRPGTDGEMSTGLGLAIVKELVAQQNGTVAVTSKEGHGTKFTVVFPELIQEDSQTRSAQSRKIAA